jgi:taurine dioxygenase
VFKTVEAVMPTHPIPDGVTLKHYAPSIGTEVHGIDLRDPLSESNFKFLSTLLLERKVIFFRDQDITNEQHLEFGRNWGELEVLPFLDYDENHPELLKIRRDSAERGNENVWHSDVSWRDEPSMGSILRSLKVPEVGGDTLWCDMVAIYEALPEPMKEMIANLKVRYSVAGIARTAKHGTVQEWVAKFPPPSHPVVRTHPETGRKLLYLSRGHLDKIEGLTRDQSEALVSLLTGYTSIPEFQCRFHWEANSIAFWDNRSTQHYAISDYFPQERWMNRVTVRGDRPF